MLIVWMLARRVCSPVVPVFTWGVLKCCSAVCFAPSVDVADALALVPAVLTYKIVNVLEFYAHTIGKSTDASSLCLKSAQSSDRLLFAQARFCLTTRPFAPPWSRESPLLSCRTSLLNSLMSSQLIVVLDFGAQPARAVAQSLLRSARQASREEPPLSSCASRHVLVSAHNSLSTNDLLTCVFADSLCVIGNEQTYTHDLSPPRVVLELINQLVSQKACVFCGLFLNCAIRLRVMFSSVVCCVFAQSQILNVHGASLTPHSQRNHQASLGCAIQSCRVAECSLELCRDSIDEVSVCNSDSHVRDRVRWPGFCIGAGSARRTHRSGLLLASQSFDTRNKRTCFESTTVVVAP